MLPPLYVSISLRKLNFFALNFLLYFAKLNDNFNVIWFSLQGMFEVLRFFPTRDQPTQPCLVCVSQVFTRSVPMAFIRINAADDYIVFKDCCGGHVCNNPTGGSTGSDSRETNDPTRA
jgi:hypothetical protein